MKESLDTVKDEEEVVSETQEPRWLSAYNRLQPDEKRMLDELITNCIRLLDIETSKHSSIKEDKPVKLYRKLAIR